MAVTLPDYPAQTELAATAWAAAFSSLILEVTDEPGHFVDLTKLIDADDTPGATPEAGRLLLTFPAPSFVPDGPDPDDDTSADPGGPYALVLRGESRELALRYLRFRTRLTRELLLALPDEA